MQEHRYSSTGSEMRKYHARVSGTEVKIPKPKNNTIGIIVSYVMLAAILAYVIYDTPAEQEVVVEKKKAPEKKVVIPKPVAESIVMSQPLWLNAPESVEMDIIEEMRVKFKLSNHNAYPVTAITLEFSFLDIDEKKVGETRRVTLEDVIGASDEMSFDDYTLGEYPAETMSIEGKVLAVSAAQ